jgi:UDP-N-acetylglucosamine acyltransferase
MVHIHPTALVDPGASLGADVEVGPFAIVEAGATLGDRTRVQAHAVIRSGVTLGADCDVHTGAALGGAAQMRVSQGPGGRVEIGPGSILREHVTVHQATKAEGATTIGARAFLLAGSHVAHDCRVGDDVTIANGALLAGHVSIGSGTFVSGNVVIHQFVKIGPLVMIAGQARVTKDVPPFALAIGDTEVCGLNVIGMRRAGMSSEARLNAKRAYAVVYRSGLNATQALARLRTLAPSAEVDAWIQAMDASARGLCPARRGRTRTASDATTEA